MARKTRQHPDTPLPDPPESDGLPEFANAAEALRRAIAEAAYYRARARGFAPGGEVQDWLAAEQEILAASRTV